MPPAPERSGLEIPHRTAAILAAAALASLLLYVLVVELILRKGLRPDIALQPDSAALMRYALYGAAVLTVVLIRVLRGLILRKRPGEDAAVLGRRLLRASVLTATLSEAPALLGLVLFLTAGLNRDFYILTAVSLVLMFMFFPRLSHWREWVAGP